jgi:hypothetical protein
MVWSETLFIIALPRKEVVKNMPSAFGRQAGRFAKKKIKKRKPFSSCQYFTLI